MVFRQKKNKKEQKKKKTNFRHFPLFLQGIFGAVSTLPNCPLFLCQIEEEKK